MLKKYFFLLATATLCFAASDEDVVSFFKGRLFKDFPNVKISVLSRENIGRDNFEKIIVEISDSGESIREVVFARDNFLLPDIYDIGNKFSSYREDFIVQSTQEDEKSFKKKALEVLKTEKNIVSIGGALKPEIYVFSDPECPFCRKHLDGIDEILKNHRVNFIFVSVHGKSAFEKIALIYKEINKSMSDSKKLEVIKKYYAENVVYTPPTQHDYEKAVNLFEKYQKLGLKAVPMVIEKE